MHRDNSPLVYLFHSDDHGATWSEPVESVLPAFGTFSTINDSTLWYTYIDDETGNVHYRTSADDGNSWSEDRLLVEADDLYDRPLVAPGNGSTLYLYFISPSEELSHRRSFLSQIFQRTSTDGGATWSSAVSLSPIDMAFVNGQGSAEFYPRRQSDGTLWIFYVAAALKEVEPPFGGTGYQATEDWNVFYRTSADGGQTWGAPQQFTRYAGKDIGAQSTVVNDQLFVLFNTSRWQPVQTGNTYLYGVPGITQDNNPPPNRSPAS